MNDISSIVDDIVFNNRSEIWCKQNYPSFIEKYPNLSKNVFGYNFDHKMFSYMMKEKNKIDKGNMSEHEASVNIGTILVDKYIKPLL